MKNALIMLFGILFYISDIAMAQQQPAVKWQKCIGGSSLDFGKGICLAKDSMSYYITGYTNSTNGDMINNSGGMDIFLSKLDLYGNVLWTRLYGNAANDYAQGIICTHDNGLLICGFTNDSVTSGTHGGFDVVFLKTDSAGNPQWMKYYGGSGDDGDHFAEVIETADMGFVCITGSDSQDGNVDTTYGSSDYWLFKTDSLGNFAWGKNFGGTDDEDGHAILPMPDGGFIMDGHSASNDVDVSGQHNPNSGIHDGWVLRVDSSLNIKWQKCVGGTGFELMNQMCFDNSGGLIIMGYTTSNDGDVTGNHGLNDYWIVRMDTASGNILSSKVYGGAGDDIGLFLLRADDGNYVAGGYSNSINGDVTGNHGNYDYWILKINPQGNIVWEKSFGGSNSDRNNGMCAAQGYGIIINGFSMSDNGNVYGNHGSNDCWVAKLGCQKTSAVFSWAPQPACIGDTVFFTNASSGAITYDWIIRDTLFSHARDTAVTFMNAGNDTVLLVSRFEQCADSLWRVVTIDSNLSVFLGHDTMICQGCSIALDAGFPGSDYVWSTGATTQQITISQTDTVWVQVTAHNCAGTDTIIIAIDTLTSISNITKSDFIIYPNPSYGNIKISPGIQGDYYLEIMMPDGRAMIKNRMYRGDAVIDTGQLDAGCYLIVIKNKSGFFAAKKLLLYSLK